MLLRINSIIGSSVSNKGINATKLIRVIDVLTFVVAVFLILFHTGMFSKGLLFIDSRFLQIFRSYFIFSIEDIAILILCMCALGIVPITLRYIFRYHPNYFGTERGKRLFAETAVVIELLELIISICLFIYLVLFLCEVVVSDVPYDDMSSCFIIYVILREIGRIGRNSYENAFCA